MQNRPSQHPRIATLDSLAASRRRTRRLQAFGAVVGAGVLALFATGCPEPGDLQNPETYQAPAVAMDDPCEVDCVKNIFAVSNTGCKLCHKSDAPLGGLDLMTKGVTARLKDVPSKHIEITPAAAPGDCPTGDKLIDVANPSASWMLTKLKGMQKTCGGAMPTAPLGTSDMACMETYISCVAGKPLGGGAAGSSSGGAGAGAGGTTAGTGGAAGGSGGTTAGSGGTGGA